jgi:hypothetical protein
MMFKLKILQVKKKHCSPSGVLWSFAQETAATAALLRRRVCQGAQERVELIFLLD